MNGQWGLLHTYQKYEKFRQSRHFRQCFDNSGRLREKYPLIPIKLNSGGEGARKIKFWGEEGTRNSNSSFLNGIVLRV